MSFLGLLSGSVWVRIYGAKPLFESAGLFILKGVNGVVKETAVLFAYVSDVVEKIESGFDTAARLIDKKIFVISNAAESAEYLLNASAENLSAASLSAAKFTDDFEIYGFEQGTDDFTDSISRGSLKLKSIQGGKIFVYLLGLVIWFIAVSISAVLILIN